MAPQACEQAAERRILAFDEERAAAPLPVRVIARLPEIPAKRPIEEIIDAIDTARDGEAGYSENTVRETRNCAIYVPAAVEASVVPLQVSVA